MHEYVGEARAAATLSLPRVSMPTCLGVFGVELFRTRSPHGYILGSEMRDKLGKDQLVRAERFGLGAPPRAMPASVRSGSS